MKERTELASRDSLREAAAEWIVTLNDPDATEADFSDWQTWMAADPAHARTFDEMQDAWGRAGSVPRVNHPPPVSVRPSRPDRRYAWAAGVALVFVTIGAAVLAWNDRAGRIDTTIAEMRSVSLPDGTRAALGPQTRLKVRYREAAREMEMSGGQAYFEVEHAPDRPFVVTTPVGRVVAVGTAFCVTLSEGRLSVAVTEGKVRIEEPAQSAQSPARPAVFVAAGAQFVSDSHGKEAVVRPVTSDPLAWRQGRLVYENEPLRVVVADINRYSSQPLILQDVRVAELRYTGTVFPDAIDVWAQSLEGVFPVRAERRGDSIVVVPVPAR